MSTRPAIDVLGTIDRANIPNHYYEVVGWTQFFVSGRQKEC